MYGGNCVSHSKIFFPSFNLNIIFNINIIPYLSGKYLFYQLKPILKTINELHYRKNDSDNKEFIRTMKNFLLFNFIFG